MAYIGAEVPEETKAEWERYVAESSHGSISELIRVSVRKEMQNEPGGGSDNLSREAKRRLDQVADVQSTIRDQIDALGQEFDEVREGSREYPKETIELAHEIATDLPEIEREEWNNRQGTIVDQELALAEEHLDPPARGKVADALEYLKDNLNHIVLTDDGYRRIKEGPRR